MYEKRGGNRKVSSSRQAGGREGGREGGGEGKEGIWSVNSPWSQLHCCVSAHGWSPPAPLQPMSLPPEKVAELRQLIHSHVTRMGVQEQIQSCLADVKER